MELAPEEKLKDQETGTLWDPISGAVEGFLVGSKLTAQAATYSLWFAWRKYRPDTVLIEQVETP